MRESILNNNVTKFHRAILILAIIFTGINLRPSITVVGPLIGTIRDDIGFANWSVALLTSLPLIAFAIMSPIAPRIGNRLTNEVALMTGLAVLIIGISIRSIKFVPLIFSGTLLIGFGIAICNVLLPGVIKERFPLKVGIMTSIYTTFMSLFATTASGVSVPLAEGANLGWQGALFIWAIPAFIAVLIWFIAYKQNNRPQREKTTSEGQSLEDESQIQNNNIWKSSLAWNVALFMGFQSVIFYITLSWLPELLMDSGMTKVTAGYMLSYFQFLGIPISFIVPIIAVRMTSQRSIIVIANTLYIIGIALLLFANSFFTILSAVTLIGIASSANFALALSFFSIRAKNAHNAAQLSGMAQSIGYIIASFGPILIGYMYDLTQVWTIPLITLIVIAVLIIIFGMTAGQNKYVLD